MLEQGSNDVIDVGVAGNLSGLASSRSQVLRGECTVDREEENQKYSVQYLGNVIRL